MGVRTRGRKARRRHRAGLRSHGIQDPGRPRARRRDDAGPRRHAARAHGSRRPFERACAEGGAATPDPQHRPAGDGDRAGEAAHRHGARLRRDPHVREPDRARRSRDRRRGRGVQFLCAARRPAGARGERTGGGRALPLPEPPARHAPVGGHRGHHARHQPDHGTDAGGGPLHQRWLGHRRLQGDTRGRRDHGLDARERPPARTDRGIRPRPFRNRRADRRGRRLRRRALMGYRLEKGGHVDRSQPIHFRWNGRRLPAFAGDTIASALLANDVAIVGRGMKLHRPRGVFAIGAEEPNALVTLGRGAEAEPSARATMIPVREGLEVRAQNAWPSVRFDIGRVLDRSAALWRAGFYHKTFMWPSWDFWERRIRRRAGIAKPPREPDPARYDAVNAHCDLLVVGGGPTGLLAAQVAARAGLSVIVAEQDSECGGRLLATNTLINEAPVTVWFASVLGELAASRSVTLLTMTTCFGLYDHGTAGLLQRLDTGNKPTAARQRYWRVHAKQTLLATGAIEQPLVFDENDLPGVMLAGAIRHYANRYGVAAGRRIVLATNNDSAYLAALDLVAAGAPVQLVVDSRTEAPADLAKWLRAQRVEVRSAASVAKAIGRGRLQR